MEPAETIEPTEPAEPEETAEPVTLHGFHVEGTVLKDVNGNSFVMRGINYPYTWYKGHLETALPAIAETGANTVRIVLSNGEQWERDSAESVARIIELCKELEMIAVLEIHDGLGSNLAKDLNLAVDYWIDIKDVLFGNEAYVIINIINEWYGKWGHEGWWMGYIPAIKALREAGLTHTLMVDAAGWGQYPESIFREGRRVFESDPLRNTMFSIHMYEASGGTGKMVKDNINKALAIDVPVVIGEFGYKHGDGIVAFQTILSYGEETDVGYIGWSWKGNSGGVEYLDIALEWDGNVLSPDWGEILIHSEFGIKVTSKKCTVF
jgi:mannan endo-1,4-beta-mannosidase